MSFGFSIGDFLAVYELVDKIYKDFADAPKQFQQISQELKCLKDAIRPIEALSSERDLSLNQRESLANILQNCKEILRDTQRTVNEYRESLEPERVHSGIRKKVKRIWKRFQLEPDDIRDLRNRMALSVTYCNAFRDELRKDREQKRDVLSWLSPIKYSAEQTDIIRRRQTGTGQWLLDSPEYQHWLATKKEVLFCPGIPGAGKTILASIVVENLFDRQRGDRSIGVCYVYLNFRQSDEQKLHHLMAGLLKQLAQTQAGLSESLKSLSDQYMSNKERPSVSELRQALCSVVAEFSRVFVVIDALDECQTDNCQQEFITELLNFSSNFEANILATSRFIPAITSRFSSAVTKEIRASDEDIAKYLDGNLSRLHGFISRDISLQQEIKESIVECVDGMFLLAKLHLDSVKDTISCKDVRVVLSRLGKGPDAYDDAYNDAMIRIKGQLPRHQDLALRTLFWITYAKRPLTTVELRYALGVEWETTEFDEDNLPDLQDMVSYCCGLVTVDEERDIIRLVHYTTQKYLECTGESWFPRAQFQIGRACITYLSFDAFESGMCTSASEYEQRLLTYPLYKYACNHGAEHAYSASDYEYCTSFFTKTFKVEACAQAMWNLKKARRPLPARLHIAAFLGLHEVAKTIIEDEDPNPIASNGETPIYEAVIQGHLSVVELLLERGVNVDSMICGWPLLGHAATRGHETMVRLLLDRGAEVDLRSTRPSHEGETALMFAASRGHESVVRLLLERGANINLRGEDGSFEETALYNAVYSGHESIIRLLLAKGADVNVGDTFQKTPLSKVAERGDAKMVRLLLANGADPDIKDDSYMTPLQYVITSGKMDRVRKREIVRLLLENDADPDCENSATNAPLWLAVDANDEEFVQLLLEYDANTEGIGYDHRTPLVLATELGHLEIVRLLLENGADINGKEASSLGKTPLMRAVEKGNQDIVRLLLEKGADVDCEDKHYGTLWPLLSSKQEMAQVFVENGVDVKSKIEEEESYEESAFFKCIRRGDMDMVQSHLNQWANLESKCKGEGPLMYALRFGHTDVARLLREHGARPSGSVDYLAY
ncbi:ankyrin repeat-containing domain protein [Xylaria curta]|nr:ankyrin repeat-containing domain protein [Xylaria curta]